MQFSRQEYWSGLPFPPPGDLPDPGIETGSPALQADSLPSEVQESLLVVRHKCIFSQVHQSSFLSWSSTTDMNLQNVI